jgi:hypothetical protein
VARRFVLVLIAALVAAGCSAGPDTSKAPRTVYVVEQIMPRGKLVASGLADGSIKAEQLPGDLVAEGALTNVDDVGCRVVATDLPVGTIMRQSYVVDASALGLTSGLTNDSVRPKDC